MRSRQQVCQGSQYLKNRAPRVPETKRAMAQSSAKPDVTEMKPFGVVFELLRP